MGDIEIDLFEKETPKTVENFVKLSKEGFYNGLIFHRVVKDFVIQGGDPEGTGRGGPGYQFDDEITERKYTKYSLGMANAGPNTNGSQFFITVGSIQDVNLRNLDGKYTLFGIVTSGKDVVDKIAVVNVDENDKPLTPVKMESITIHES
jgi:cyclophilin family peptidyl-prolyl cis-trans isomerase